MLIARLSQPDGDPEGFAALRADFESRNPGYRIEWLPGARELAAADASRLAFVHGSAADRVHLGGRESSLRDGDVAVVRAGQTLSSGTPLGLLVFTVPAEPDAAIPSFLRPDDDPVFTDTPGGCATEQGAYRRVVLTWLRDNGPFRFQALNTHRVRMTDSFSHYHPHDGGFDELYLVQHVAAEGRLYTSDRVDRIERPDEVTTDELEDIVTETELRAGDLVCVGRGNMHRAVGGVLAHVITVPGFVPGQEIGVDHHLRAIAERLGRPLPYNVAASTAPVIK